MRVSAKALALPTALFALHTFLLMGTGVWSGSVSAAFDEAFRATIYYARESALALGFLLHALITRWQRLQSLSQRAFRALRIVAAVLFACSVLLLALPTTGDQPTVHLVAQLIVALLVGVLGGMSYVRIAYSVADAEAVANGRRGYGGRVRILGLIVGLGGALAVVAQYVLHIRLSIDGALPVLFVVCCLALVLLMPSSSSGSAPKDGRGHVAGEFVGRVSFGRLMVSAIVVSACLFALFPFYESIMSKLYSTAFFYEWHRLFLAVGYILVGVISYAGGRFASSLAISAAALFSVIFITQASSLAVDDVATCLFYALLGGAIAWSGITFMSLAPQGGNPGLIASAGRILEALATIAGGFLSPGMPVSSFIVLLVTMALLAIMVVFMVQGGFLAFSAQAESSERQFDRAGRGAELLAGQGLAPASMEERVQAVASECQLTEREQQVFALLVMTEEKNQQIADRLGISRRQLQNHISRIYEKTGTRTRAGLVMLVNE